MLTFAQLRSIVELSTDPAGPAPYRELYGIQNSASPLTISSWEEWRALPLMTKDVMNATPFEKRLFAPRGAIDHVRATSGTSGRPSLFCPRTHVRGMDYRLAYHDFKGAFLAFTVPLMPHWHEMFMASHGRVPRVVVHDPRYPAASARLARAAGVDALSVFLYHVIPLGEEMKKLGMHTRIKLLEVTGETCSRAHYEYMRATFPNARIVQSYNSSEVEDAHIGIPCRAMTGEDPLAVYHAKETHYLELIDRSSGAVLEPKAGVEGDLVITSYPGEPSAFPLIRYRIGDTVRVVEDDCGHGSWSFTVLGRTDMDFVKVPGGILRADEIARVLRLFPDEVTDRFELHCSEATTSGGPKVEPILHVEVRPGAEIASLAQRISSALRVAPDMTYEDGVRLGRYLPLTCKPLVLVPGSKQKRIVLHD